MFLGEHQGAPLFPLPDRRDALGTRDAFDSGMLLVLPGRRKGDSVVQEAKLISGECAPVCWMGGSFQMTRWALLCASVMISLPPFPLCQCHAGGVRPEQRTVEPVIRDPCHFLLKRHLKKQTFSFIFSCKGTDDHESSL